MSEFPGFSLSPSGPSRLLLFFAYDIIGHRDTRAWHAYLAFFVLRGALLRGRVMSRGDVGPRGVQFLLNLDRCESLSLYRTSGSQVVSSSSFRSSASPLRTQLEKGSSHEGGASVSRVALSFENRTPGADDKESFGHYLDLAAANLLSRDPPWPPFGAAAAATAVAAAVAAAAGGSFVPLSLRRRSRINIRKKRSQLHLEPPRAVTRRGSRRKYPSVSLSLRCIYTCTLALARCFLFAAGRSK